MLAIAIIYFREFLEISLIVGIIIAATKNLSNRYIYIFNGIIAGTVISLVFAYLINTISKFVNEEFEDIFTAIILSINVIIIGYTVIWMQNNAKNFTTNLNKITDNIKNSKIPLYSLTIVIATAIIREGIEIALYTYGIFATSQNNNFEIILGAISGSIFGTIIGLTLYLGLIKISVKYFFRITSLLLSLLAANLAAQIPIYLESAGILSVFTAPVWDSSWFINDQSIIGKMAHSIFGYTDKPNLMQLIFYSLTLVTIKLSDHFLFKSRNNHSFKKA
ncbi:MAG: FTR1 family protein [Alphaproteobacteria bacterium]